MKRALGGLGLVAHGLAHGLPGAQAGAAGRSWLLSALGIGPVPLRWAIAVLSAVAMCGFVAAGFGLWGAPAFRGRWRRLAMVAIVASLVLLALFWVNAYGVVGLAVDLVVLAVLRTTGVAADGSESAKAAPGKHRFARALGNVVAVAFIAWLGLISVTGPLHRLWGSTASELSAALPGDGDFTGPPTYLIQHAVTIHAPAEEVWPWIAQLGTDRGGFYSYDFLERAFGIQVHNAEHVHEEWQDVHTGGFVVAAPAGYLGIDHPIGWKLTHVEYGRVMVLENWGAFVLVPVDDHTTRFIVRTRNGQPASVMGLVMAWFGLVAFEPTHFLMERQMMLGVKRRAETATGL